MRKILLILSILLALSLVLTSCENEEECEHNFIPATCQSPMTCVLCGKTTGEIGNHAWNTKKCLETQVCKRCDFVGDVVEHTWDSATCISPEICIRCGVTSKDALGHDWKIISCDSPKVCQRCGNEEIDRSLSHEWLYKGCDMQRVCSICSQKEGVLYGHTWVEATCTVAKYCKMCNTEDGRPIAHEWEKATCTLPKTCANCKTSAGNPIGHNWQLISVGISPTGKEIETYSCSICDGISEIDVVMKCEYHICDADGLCSQCNKRYDPKKMTLESVLIENAYSVECCGTFTSTETPALIYKPITSQDVGMPVIDLGGVLPTEKGYTNVVEFTYDSDGVSFICTAEIKVQGASSAGKPKKNFNIKLFKSDGSKNKVELCDGWGKENKYCMKANYIDYSQSRNVVSGKIFGEIVKSRNDELAGTPNGGAIDGYPILVYNNGEYQGLYTMNIPKDNWMFDMKHSDEKNQAIFMTSTWNSAVSFKAISTSGFTLEFASNEDSLVDNNTQWAYESMLDLIEFVYYNDGEDFKNGIHEYADIEKCIDSMLYTFFICADDNTSKNILWVTLDGKVWFSSMYDMDGTWGMRWNGNIEFDENTLLISSLADGKGLAPERNPNNLNLLWERIYVNYFDLVCERYAELRQEILTVDNISYHFAVFFDAIPDVVREAEKQKWTGVPSQSVDHLAQIITFAKKRIVVMDEILKYVE